MHTSKCVVMLAVLAGWTGITTGETFVPIITMPCITDTRNLFTTNRGDVQYPQAGDGVSEGWSMAMRWQGEIAGDSVSYDLSRYTGFKFERAGALYVPPVGHRNMWQRGQQPESSYGTPGAQIFCGGGGIFTNTWTVPHREIVGGGYNNMFGYRFKAGTEPSAFYVHDGDGVLREGDLVLQAEIGVGWYAQFHVNKDNPPPVAQVAMLISLIDQSHPDLHPIVLVTPTHDAGPTIPNPDGYVGCDFGPIHDPTKKGGVWFSGGSITPENVDPYRTVVYTGGYSKGLTPVDDPNAPPQFFRIHHTPEDVLRFINKINSLDVGTACPKNGYSTDLRDYVVSYAAIIVESVLFDGMSRGSFGGHESDQVSVGASFYGLGVYLYLQD